MALKTTTAAAAAALLAALLLAAEPPPARAVIPNGASILGAPRAPMPPGRRARWQPPAAAMGTSSRDARHTHARHACSRARLPAAPQHPSPPLRSAQRTPTRGARRAPLHPAAAGRCGPPLPTPSTPCHSKIAPRTPPRATPTPCVTAPVTPPPEIPVTGTLVLQGSVVYTLKFQDDYSERMRTIGLRVSDPSDPPSDQGYRVTHEEAAGRADGGARPGWGGRVRPRHARCGHPGTPPPWRLLGTGGSRPGSSSPARLARHPQLMLRLQWRHADPCNCDASN